MTAPAIVLIGPMGAGKSSIGKKLAKRLELGFSDSDSIVVREHGPIERIFTEQGEAHFRTLERRAVADALRGGGVVALGGGAVLHPDTQTDLAGHLVVLLTVSERTIASRIRDSARPLLQGEDPLARWREVYAARRDLYERLADLTVDTSSGPIQQIVDELADRVRKEPS